MSHQGVTAGLHNDGIYHDSHALEYGGTPNGALVRWYPDTYNRRIVVETAQNGQLWDMDGGGFMQLIPGFLDTGCFFANSPNLRYFGMDGGDPAVYDYDGNLILTFSETNTVSASGGNGAKVRTTGYVQRYYPVPLHEGYIFCDKSTYNNTSRNIVVGSPQPMTISNFSDPVDIFRFESFNQIHLSQFVSDNGDIGTRNTSQLLKFSLTSGASGSTWRSFFTESNKWNHRSQTRTATVASSSNAVYSIDRYFHLINSSGGDLINLHYYHADVDPDNYMNLQLSNYGGDFMGESKRIGISSEFIYATTYGADLETGQNLGNASSVLTPLVGLSENVLLADKSAIIGLAERIDLSTYLASGVGYHIFDGDFLYWNFDNKIYRINLTTLVIELIVECVP